jgi:hypothetical protein
VWGEALRAGKAKRDPSLGDLEVFAGPTLASGDDVEPLREFVKPHLALYIGGMGAAEQELLPHPGHQVRLRRRGRPHPGALSGRQKNEAAKVAVLAASSACAYREIGALEFGHSVDDP